MAKAWKDIELIETCGGCPEQYDAYYDDKYVGYLRLRHGVFTVRTEPIGDLIWHTHPNGDGMFIDDDERGKMLKKACKKIAKFHGLDSPPEV